MYVLASLTWRNLCVCDVLSALWDENMERETHGDCNFTELSKALGGGGEFLLLPDSVKGTKFWNSSALKLQPGKGKFVLSWQLQSMNQIIVCSSDYELPKISF